MHQNSSEDRPFVALAASLDAFLSTLCWTWFLGLVWLH